jgi:large subunit ribosomal protein L9
MAREVILMEDVEGLGYTGDIVRVAEGYARNFLLPRNLAAPVSAGARRMVEKRRLAAEEKRTAMKADAESAAAKLKEIALEIKVKTGIEDRLYGSVTTADLAAALAKKGVTVTRQQIHLAEPIRALGTFSVPVKLHRDVEAAVKVDVVKE